MNKELLVKNQMINRSGTNLNNFEFEDKNEALRNFINYTQNNNKSAVYDYFYGCMKTKTACDGCAYTNRKTAYYSFNSFNFVSFNLDLVQKQCKNQNNINLEKLFEIQNNICIKIDTNKMKYCKYY
jgi:hypothetical protein